jgi:hypothetical protein
VSSASTPMPPPPNSPSRRCGSARSGWRTWGR